MSFSPPFSNLKLLRLNSSRRVATLRKFLKVSLLLPELINKWIVWNEPTCDCFFVHNSQRSRNFPTKKMYLLKIILIFIYSGRYWVDFSHLGARRKQKHVWKLIAFARCPTVWFVLSEYSLIINSGRRSLWNWIIEFVY